MNLKDWQALSPSEQFARLGSGETIPEGASRPVRNVEEKIFNLCESLPSWTTVGRVCLDINTMDANNVRKHASACKFDRLYDDLLRIGQNEASFWKHVQELVNSRIIDEQKQDELLGQMNELNDALSEEMIRILRESCSCKTE